MPSPMRRFSRLWFSGLTAAMLGLTPAAALAVTGNGKLQLHHMKIGQGDGILLISPNGQTALFDNGVYTNCTYIKSHLQSLGVTSLDYSFLSHYHADHLGCLDDLAAINIAVATAGYDRGYSYSSASYTTYVNTLGAKRQTIAAGQTITLDAASPNPVTIKCVSVNGAGVYSPTGSDENAKSAVYLVSYGGFSEVIGGDLTGDGATDVETTMGPLVGNVDVYKVHHHGSRYSTNDNWLGAITAEVAIIQCGTGNSYGHPTLDALTRLHNHNVKTYWTETGAGAAPDAAWDKVANENVLLQADLATNSYTISGPGFSDTYPFDGGGGPPPILNDTRVASSVTVLNGTVAQGSYASLAVDDNTKFIVSSKKVGSNYWTDWYGEMVLAHPALTLTVTYNGSFNTSRTQTLYLWNWQTSAWVQIDQSTVSTTDVTRTWNTSAPAAYVSPTGQVRLRVLGNNRTSSYTSRGDYMAVSYDYYQGTGMTRTPIEYAAMQPADFHEPRVDAFPQARVQRLEASADREGARLAWAVDIREHVDGFNVYRAEPDGSLLFVGHEALIETTAEEAVFGFSDPAAPAGESWYWLGARACAGPEGMVGPIRIERAALAPVAGALAFAAGPNPARGSLTFALELPAEGEARIEVFDLSGRRVATPFSGRLVAGRHALGWDSNDADGSALGSGIYFARLEVLGQTRLARLTLLSR